MKCKKINSFSFLVIVSFLALAVMLTSRVFQNDTFYTIKVGEVILNYGVDMQDHFSFIGNLAYTYPHFLYDIFIYMIYYYFGFFGIYISTIVLTFILLMSMYHTTCQIISDRGISYLLVLFLGFTLRDFVTARAQLVSYILLLFVQYSLERLQQSGERKYSWYLFFLSWLIASMHAAIWPFALVLFLPYLVSFLFSFLQNRYFPNSKFGGVIQLEKPRYPKKFLLTFVSCLLSGFLTPNHFVPFTYLVQTKMGITMSYISEHLPVTIEKRPTLFFILFLVILLLLQKEMKLSLKDFFLLCGLFLLAFLSKRSYALLAILAIFVFARIVKCFLETRVSFSLESVLGNPIIFSVILLLFCISTPLFLMKESKKEFVDSSKYPVELATYMIENLTLSDIRIYNEYNFGSYLLYRGIPVFFDSRADLYTEEFNPSCEVFRDGVNLFSRYREVFEKYNITHVVLSNTNKLRMVLDLDSDYRVLYIDSHFTLYKRLTN